MSSINFNIEQEKNVITDSPAYNTSLYPRRAGRRLCNHRASTVTLYREEKIK